MADGIRGFARIVAALATAFLVLTLAVIRLAHGSPMGAMSALIQGAFGSPYALGSTLNKTTPLAADRSRESRSHSGHGYGTSAARASLWSALWLRSPLAVMTLSTSRRVF